MYQLGVDIGGTFTDAVLIDDEGSTWSGKAPSTADPRGGFLAALALVVADTERDSETVRGELTRIMYGTTIATNVAVQMTGATVGLITTRGFGDSILMMQGHGYVAGVPDDLVTHVQVLAKPDPIVPRARIREVTERVDANGEVVVPLDQEDARRAVRELVEAGVKAFAVCFLWSFADASHEREMRAIVESEAPGAFVTLSSELAPRAGEYTRTVATALNAYTGPAVADHVTDLQRSIKECGVPGRLNVLHCGGGVFTPEEAGSSPVKLIGSGPVGGVLASRKLGERLGEKNILTADMGGTTFDVGIIVDGTPASRSSSVVGQYEYMVPTVDIQSIGSGGGSIVWVDEISGSMRVGPMSAGSDPGPVCYRKGGELPTVSDCDLLVGYLNPDNFLGGGMALDLEHAHDALEEHVARPLGMSVIDAARGALRIVNMQMAELIRQMTVARGYDPRDFVIFAFGGAGPLHAPFFSAELGSRGVVVPGGPLSSVWSAYGAAISDTVLVLERSHAQRAPFDAGALEAAYLGVEDEARSRMRAAGADPETVRMRRLADLRYGMQVHLVEVEAPAAIAVDNVEAIVDAFDRKYAELFGPGTGFRAAGVEMAAIRVKAVVANRAGQAPSGASLGAAPAGSATPAARPVHWPDEEGSVESAIVGETELVPGAVLDGPAVLELSTTTIPLPSGWRATVDETGSFLLEAPTSEGRR